jgi:hypothetical protein
MGSILDRLLQDETSLSIEGALSLLLNWLENHQNEAKSMQDYAARLLTRSSAINGRGMVQFYWEHVTEFYIESLTIDIAQAILGSLREVEDIALADDTRMNVLRQCLINRPEEVWPLIGEMLLRKDIRGHGLRISMRNWGVENAGTSTLIQWAKAHEPDGPCVLGEIAVPLSSLARQLLIEFDTRDCVGNGLVANFLSGSYSGSSVVWLQTKLDTARGWANDDQIAIRDWASKLVKFIEEDIKRSKQREEEEELLW